jgi:hypothetical protein
VCRYLASQGFWEEVWVMPVYKHMFTKDSSLETFDHRVAMCQLNFAHIPRVRVVKLEKEVRIIGIGFVVIIIRMMVVVLRIHRSRRRHHHDHHLNDLFLPSAGVCPVQVMEHHLELARNRGEDESQVRIGTIDVVCYLKDRLPATELSLTLGKLSPQADDEGRERVMMMMMMMM